MWCASAATCAPSRSLSTASSTVAASRPAPATTKRSCSDAPSGSASSSRKTCAARSLDVLPLERSSGSDRGRIAGRVAVALLDRGSRHDDVIDGLRERALRRAGDQPRLAREPAHRLERQRGPAFVRDRDEDVGLGRVPENDLERLRGATAREGRVVRRAAAGEQDARALGQPAIADPLGHLPKPLGLLGDGLSGQLSGHEACLYHRTPWPSSRRRRWATGFAS